MNARTLAIAIALFLLAVFALLNWSAFSTPTALTLGFAEVQAPLGLVMLVVTGIVSGLFLVYIVYQQAGAILESRRYEKELRANRELADKAEASRFTELRAYLASELGRLQSQRATESQQVGARMEQLEERLQQRMDESARGLSAHLGEVEDKLDRVIASKP
ncbi:MAG: LapA family protein [Piscinibacter sp.]|nr:LapA family protein [Piscinibacter sp.]